MVFLWFSYGFPMFSQQPNPQGMAIASGTALEDLQPFLSRGPLPAEGDDGHGGPGSGSAENVIVWRMFLSLYHHIYIYMYVYYYNIYIYILL